jgi:hypothetical protein
MIDPAPWANRVHPGPRAAALPLTAKQREAVLAAVRPAKTELRVAKRAQALLLMAAGVGPSDIVRLLGVHPRTVEKWKARFVGVDDVAAKLADAPRSGRPPSLSRTRTRRAS